MFQFYVSQRKSKAGFTLMELIVVVGIIALISGVSLWNGKRFDDATGLSSVAQDVSLLMRQTQNYGASGKETSIGSGVFTVGYGLYINNTSPTYIVSFLDNNNNNMYDNAGCTGECIERLVMRNNVSIQSSNGVCAVNYSGGQTCATAISFTFVRPKVDANIVLLNSSGVPVSGGPWASGFIVLRSVGGLTKTISVNKVGQINVQ